MARIVAQRLSAQLGQQLVIENRGGAGGTLGTAVVARAPADGYHLVVGTTSTHVVAPSVYQKLDYDPVKDFAPISLMAAMRGFRRHLRDRGRSMVGRCSVGHPHRRRVRIVLGVRISLPAPPTPMKCAM